MLTAVAQVCWPRWRPPKERTPPARSPRPAGARRRASSAVHRLDTGTRRSRTVAACGAGRTRSVAGGARRRAAGHRAVAAGDQLAGRWRAAPGRGAKPLIVGRSEAAATQHARRGGGSADTETDSTTMATSDRAITRTPENGITNCSHRRGARLPRTASPPPRTAASTSSAGDGTDFLDWSGGRCGARGAASRARVHPVGRSRRQPLDFLPFVLHNVALPHDHVLGLAALCDDDVRLEDRRREVVVDIAGVDARGPQRVALQVQRLGAVRLRDAGVADQHVS